jgi:hypothetical protein
MQESDHRKVIGKINAAIPVLRDRLRELEPQPGCEMEKRHLRWSCRHCRSGVNWLPAVVRVVGCGPISM